ncbi:hypothetical protein LAH08_02001 [Micromonospora noduli]|uniref:Uncharacterized protein n=1 Tax=Micromonospora noduli TaxID=709876 RepID=A0A328NAC0_9ACTN|nr:hypothetical protein LAH08_02001 [Micromonospora noduli]
MLATAWALMWVTLRPLVLCRYLTQLLYRAGGTSPGPLVSQTKIEPLSSTSNMLFLAINASPAWLVPPGAYNHQPLSAAQLARNALRAPTSLRPTRSALDAIRFRSCTKSAWLSP